MATSDIRRALAAREFARRAHEAVGQRRKYTGEPYIVHPDEVAEIVSTIPHSLEMIQASYLHDTLEDTAVTAGEIRDNFGPVVLDYVVWLTGVSKPQDGSRENRKAIDRAHSAKAPAPAQTIKVADIISNVSSIIRYDPSFAAVYVPEKSAQLAVLTLADPVLLSRARKLVGAAIEQLRPMPQGDFDGARRMRA